MNLLLAALGKDVKPAGRDKWVAKCPVHRDKDFAMGIKQNADGSVIANCLACGANGLDLYKALGLDLDEMFGGKDKGNYVSQKQRNEYSEDAYFMAIYDADQKAGKKISYGDRKRYNLAQVRSKNLRGDGK